MKICEHFDREEFDCHDGSEYPGDWIVARLAPLCEVLERLRWVLGGAAISIVSGYRSPAYNARIGGASASQHTEGRAADIRVKGFTAAEVHDTLLRLFRSGRVEIGGLGLYAGWVHVDVRPRPKNGHLAQWVGAGVGSEPG